MRIHCIELTISFHCITVSKTPRSSRATQGPIGNVSLYCLITFYCRKALVLIKININDINESCDEQIADKKTPSIYSYNR